MKTSIATVSISGNLPEKLKAIAEAGFSGIEIFEQDFIAHDGGASEVAKMASDLGLEILLFQPFRDFECLPEPLRMKAFDRAERKFDLMHELGTDLVLVCSSVHPDSMGGIDRAAEDLCELGGRAAKRGLRVGYEALAWGKHVNDHRDAWEIVRRADHPNTGLILDSFHTLGRKLSPESIRSIPGDKIFFIQLADAPAIDMDLLFWSRHFRNMPGEGDLDVSGFMRAVMATGYSGPVSLEIFNDQFRGGNPRRVAQDGYRALLALMDDVRRKEPELRCDLSDFPGRVSVEGISFVEFATRGSEADQLEAVLYSLGFEKSAEHRNKAVSLFEQGDIKIVVNRETEGHAAHSWNARGTCVCDIGISVASAADTMLRAEALGSKPFSQELGAGELEIPAIRGLSGSILHFIDRQSGLDAVWDLEFERTREARSPGAGAGLKRIDHLAQTMSYEEMLSWTLFYLSLFEMSKSPMVDVIDPDGLVRSQVVESRDGGLRVTLNGAETHRTLAGQFLAETFGASVQHIAFESADIFQTAETIERHGFKRLPMPENYYADLAARFDLPPSKLAEMKKLDILYDRDDRGEFFQFYSQSISGGVFFEMMERRNGYLGFGAANAPFRIAAQKRMVRPKGMPRQ